MSTINQLKIRKHLDKYSKKNDKNFYECCANCQHCKNIVLTEKGWWHPVCDNFQLNFNYKLYGKSSVVDIEKCPYNFEKDYLYEGSYRICDYNNIIKMCKIMVDNGYMLVVNSNRHNITFEKGSFCWSLNKLSVLLDFIINHLRVNGFDTFDISYIEKVLINEFTKN